MKTEIKPLEYNRATLPASILRYLNIFGLEKTIPRKNDKPFKILMKPFGLHPIFKDSDGDHECYMLEKNWEFFNRMIKDEAIFDEKWQLLTPEKLQDYYVKYAKGFEKGYFEFLVRLKDDQAFQLSDEDFALKIFSRVYSIFPPIKDGGFGIADVKNENGKFQCKITHEIFYQSGYEGGEFYKAWEVILANPLRFEKLFNEKISGKTSVQNKQLGLSQIAIIHYYEGLFITRDNGNIIAKNYGLNSGEKLYQKFIYYSHRSNRIGDEGTPAKITNKIKLLESIGKHLSKKAKAIFDDELKIIKSYL